MLPLYPTLLFQPRKETLDRLSDLVIAIDCPLEDLNTRSYFIENYIHCNKTKLLIILEERFEWLSLERGLTAVSEHINWLKRLQVKRNFLLLLSVSHFDHTTKNN